VLLQLILACGAWILANHVFDPPGVSPDTLWQYQQALTNRYETVKPPFMAMLMHASNALGHPSIRNYVLVQSALFSGSITVLVCTVFRGAVARVVAAVVLMFNPISLIYSVIAWVDVLMASFMMLAISAGLSYLASPRWWKLCLTAALFALAASVRHEAMIVVAALSAVTAIHLWRTGDAAARRRVRAVVLAAILAVAASRVWEHLPNVTGHVSWSHFNFMNQYVGTLYHARRNGKGDSEAFRRYTGEIDRHFGPGTAERLFQTYEPIPNFYAWVFVNPVVGWDKGVTEGRFMADELPSLVARYPREWAQHKLSYLSLYVTALPPQVCVGLCIDPILKPPGPEALGVTAQSSPAIVRWQGRLVAWATRAMSSTPLRLWFALAVSVLAGLVGALRGRRAHVALAVAGLSHASVFLLLDVYWEWRYFLFFYLSGSLSLMLLALDVASSLRASLQGIFRRP
jgi:hypothetical protein